MTSFLLDKCKIITLFEKHISLIPVEIHQTNIEAACFNIIYLITLPVIPSKEFTNTHFFLRLSKPFHPRIKTQNEVKLPGETLCNIWETIDPQRIVQQIVSIILELRAVTSNLSDKWFGGMTANGEPNAFVEITFYTIEHISQYWPSSEYPNESYETLNLTSSFSSWR